MVSLPLSDHEYSSLLEGCCRARRTFLSTISDKWLPVSEWPHGPARAFLGRHLDYSNRVSLVKFICGNNGLSPDDFATWCMLQPGYLSCQNSAFHISTLFDSFRVGSLRGSILVPNNNMKAGEFKWIFAEVQPPFWANLTRDQQNDLMEENCPLDRLFCKKTRLWAGDIEEGTGRKVKIVLEAGTNHYLGAAARMKNYSRTLSKYNNGPPLVSNLSIAEGLLGLPPTV